MRRRALFPAILAAVAALSLANPAISAPSGCPMPSAKRLRLLEEAEKAQQGDPGDFSGWLGTSDGEYCRREPKALLCTPHKPKGTLPLAAVQRIDKTLRAHFTYQDDFLHYGQWDRWDDDSLCGDCEDYALVLAKRLYAAGEGGAHMALVLWMVPEDGMQYGHATLLIETADQGDVEISVGDGGEPAPMDWSYGKRLGMILLDGQRNWMLRIPAGKPVE